MRRTRNEEKKLPRTGAARQQRIPGLYEGGTQKRAFPGGLPAPSHNGVVPQDAPPPDYYHFMRELHGVGNNLNQIAQKAHVLGVVDERRYDEEMKKFDRLVRDITKAVILPRPME